MAYVASQLIQEVTVHAQSDSLEDAREICADGTYFPNNLRMYNQRKCIVAELRKLPSYRPDISLYTLKPPKEEKEVKCHTVSLVPLTDLTLPYMETTQICLLFSLIASSFMNKGRYTKV